MGSVTAAACSDAYAVPLLRPALLSYFLFTKNQPFTVSFTDAIAVKECKLGYYSLFELMTIYDIILLHAPSAFPFHIQEDLYCISSLPLFLPIDPT